MKVTVDLKTIINKLQLAFDRIQKLEEENEKLVDALEFYSDYKNDDPDNEWNNDLARQVLKDIGKE